MSTTSDPRVGNRAAEADVDAAPTFPPVTLSPISELGAPRSGGGTQYGSSQQGNDGGRLVLFKVGLLSGT